MFFVFPSIKMHQEKKTKARNEDDVPDGAVPAYLLDREKQSRAKVLSNMIKQKRKEKAVSYQPDNSTCQRKSVTPLSVHLNPHNCTYSRVNGKYRCPK